MHDAAKCNIYPLPKFSLGNLLRIGYIAQMVEGRYDNLEIAGQCCFEPANMRIKVSYYIRQSMLCSVQTESELGSKG